jgi:hypothetical protein
MHGLEEIGVARGSLVVVLAVLSTACASTAVVGTPPTLAARADVGRPKQILPAPWTNFGTSIHAPTPAPEPLLQSTPAGLRVVDTATRMVDEGTIVRGSCYRYIDRVFQTAGYRGWRRRTTVFRGPRSGPYASLDAIQPGDWLWIVNHPDRTPVGTHSVLFVDWYDRSAGIARVISYVGRSERRPADVTTYDVSRTYSIQRPIDPEPRPDQRR